MACKCGNIYCVCLNDPLDQSVELAEQEEPDPGRAPWECEN